MALISCIECGNSVSTKAVACPHCGAPKSLLKEIPPSLSVPSVPPSLPERTPLSVSPPNRTTIAPEHRLQPAPASSSPPSDGTPIIVGIVVGIVVFYLVWQLYPSPTDVSPPPVDLNHGSIYAQLCRTQWGGSLVSALFAFRITQSIARRIQKSRPKR